MDTLYNEIDKIVNDIRALKSFIIFEGSKFINKIITSSSDKDFIEFLKLKLKPSEAIGFPDKRSVFEKIFKKRPEIKSLDVNYVTPDIFNRITSAMEEWNSSNKKTISDEKFKIIRMFVEKLSAIELNVSALYEESQNCDDLKQQKKSLESGNNRVNIEVNPKNNQEINSESPESKDGEIPPKRKPKKQKSVPLAPSVEEVEKIREEKATKLLEEITEIFNSSTKVTEALKKYFQDKINENKDKLMDLLKEIIYEKNEKEFKNTIAGHIKYYDNDPLNNDYHIRDVLELLLLIPRQ
jgi:hypothetical protein